VGNLHREVTTQGKERAEARPVVVDEGPRVNSMIFCVLFVASDKPPSILPRRQLVCVKRNPVIEFWQEHSNIVDAKHYSVGIFFKRAVNLIEDAEGVSSDYGGAALKGVYQLSDKTSPGVACGLPRCSVETHGRRISCCHVKLGSGNDKETTLEDFANHGVGYTVLREYDRVGRRLVEKTGQR